MQPVPPRCEYTELVVIVAVLSTVCKPLLDLGVDSNLYLLIKFKGDGYRVNHAVPCIYKLFLIVQTLRIVN